MCSGLTLELRLSLRVKANIGASSISKFQYMKSAFAPKLMNKSGKMNWPCWNRQEGICVCSPRFTILLVTNEPWLLWDLWQGSCSPGQWEVTLKAELCLLQCQLDKTAWVWSLHFWVAHGIRGLCRGRYHRRSHFHCWWKWLLNLNKPLPLTVMSMRWTYIHMVKAIKSTSRCSYRNCFSYMKW